MVNLSYLPPLGKKISWFRYRFGVNLDNNLTQSIALVTNFHHLSLYQQDLINNSRDLITRRDNTNDITLVSFVSDMIVNIACD